MRLSAQADYAVVMLSATARHCGGALRLNATLLAEETGLPLPTVQKLVSRLSSAGLIESTRGTGGGFRLSRPPAAISLADIVEAIEGPIALTACIDAGKHDCAIEGNCRVKPHANAVNGAVRGALAGISLATISRPTPFVSSPSTARRAGAQDELPSMTEVETHYRAERDASLRLAKPLDFARDERLMDNI